MWKYFDIISFDPRGVNASRPLLTCFPDRIEAAIYNLEEEAHGYIGTSDTSFDNLWASKRAVADGCSKRMADEVRMITRPRRQVWYVPARVLTRIRCRA